ncbi:DinB family protein [Paractinoplanes rishiriensis]|uniref:DinB family protein n=1 Tax=Paractinoplanes rishiriensis TaxID=1050105 RepID=A0A919MZX7_9ACTN|nr:DinB family protein [Actinoplanes rishiriensis]GIF02099.1 hypothetical protein Ari01nite_95630 [Actinoplanes rishiriensis]
MEDPKAALVFYLTRGREALIWKTENLSEYDVRRPLVPTGTNLLGLLKHVTGVVAGYFGECFGRPFPEPLPWMAEDAEPNADMWATEDESRDHIVALYHRAWDHAEATIAALPLDATGEVPWWPADRNRPTLHRVLIHMIAETERHTGQADIVRELVDGAAGARAEFSNLPDRDTAWWTAYHARLEQAARAASG